MSTRGRSHSRLRTGVQVTLAATMLAAVVFAGYWSLSGGRWFIVRTPSMGMAAPVGTLLWVKPVEYSQLHVGDFITFRPPGSNTTYSHRIAAINADGTVSTKGDANGSRDPWLLSEANVIGRVQLHWWGAGWLIRAGPMLIIGGLLLWLLVRRYAALRWRLPLRIVGTAVLLSLSVFLLRPLVGAERIALTPSDGGVSATYVSTGLLPLRLAAVHGPHLNLVDGQTGSVFSPAGTGHGRILVTLAPNVPLWFWLALVLACFLPALITAAIGSWPESAGGHAAARRGLPLAA